MSGILAFSAILWVFIDRAKKLWAELSWGKWITTAFALAGGFLLAFGLLSEWWPLKSEVKAIAIVLTSL